MAIKDESRPIVNVYNKKTTSSSRSGYDSISGSFSGSFSEDGSGSITGTIKGNIPGFGSIIGSVSGSMSDNDSDFILGSIKGSISGKGSVSGVSGGSVGTPSGDNSGSGVVILNKGGGFVVENMTQNITSFIECTNIGVSIVELSPDDIN